MDLIRLDCKVLWAIALLTTLMIAPGLVRAQSKYTGPYETTASYQAFNSAFLVQSGATTYYGNTVNDHKEAFLWGQASDIFIDEDYYQHTHDPAALSLIKTLLDRFIKSNGTDWKWDTWNDDIEWSVLACIWGYQITGNSSYLTVAENNWNMTYARGWDDVDGGGIWENQDKYSKCALSNDPFAIAGCALYSVTNNSTYLTESEAAYSWVRTHIVSLPGSPRSLGPTGQVNEALTNKGELQYSDNVYNAGSFLEAANCLRRLTRDSSYLTDEELVIQHIVGEGAVLAIKGSPGNPQYQYWFVKGLADFCTDNAQWKTYLPWLLGNANTAWQNRDSLNLTEDDWKDPNTNANPAGLNASSAVAIWQFIQYPKQFKIVNAYTGLAMGLNGGNETDESEVDQWTPNPDDSGQRWLIVPLADGHDAIISTVTGMAIAFYADPSTGTTHLADHWFSIDDATEQFDLVSQGGDACLIKSTVDGTVLNDYHGEKTNGTKIVPLAPTGRPNQSWFVELAQ